MRRTPIIVSLVLAVVFVIGLGAVALLGAMDFAGPVGRYAARKAGRPLTIASLRVRPGRWLFVEMQDIRLANVPGGSTPEMATIKRASAEIDVLSLLTGPLILRRLDLDGLQLVLERDAEGIGNWKLGDPATKHPPPAPDDPGGRANVPTLLDAVLHIGEISYRTSSGAILRMGLAGIALHADDSEQPITLAGAGTYNGNAVSLRATTAPFTEMHKPSVPLGMDLTVATRESELTFKGSAMDPLHLDGVDGALELDTRKVGEFLATFQLHTAANPPMRLAGKLLWKGNLWQLLDATGTLSAEKFTGKLELTEGKRTGPKRTEPDHLVLELAFDKLDLGELMSRSGVTGGTSRSSDTLPTVDTDPGLVGEAKIRARRIVYKMTEMTDASARGAIMPGKVTLGDAHFTIAGAKADFSAVMQPANLGTSLSGAAKLDGADLGQLSQVLGIARPPLDGRLVARATWAMAGLSLSDALKASREFAVLSMNGGAVSRQLVQTAAADVRALFGGGNGSARVTCLLAIADLRGLAGPVAPVRLVTSEGTIEGFGQVDLLRKWLDVTIRSEPSTTNSVALDVPIRIRGEFESPSVLPASDPFNRAELRDAFALRQLPPDLQQSARASSCLK